MASEGYHEPLSSLDEDVINRHRVITSIMEELEAVDWYDQRVTATNDESLAAILAHNRDEEKEHAAMAIEWLRRHDATFDEELRAYLFSEGPITHLEEEAMGSDASSEEAASEPQATSDSASSSTPHSLRIGTLKNHPEGEPT